MVTMAIKDQVTYDTHLVVIIANQNKGVKASVILCCETLYVT